MERLGFVSTVLACLVLAAGPAWADVFAVAKPTMQSYGSVWNGAYQRRRG